MNLDFIIATTAGNENCELISFCLENNIKYYQGDKHNIPLRFLNLAEHHDISNLILLDGDDILSSVDGVFIVFQFLNLKYTLVKTENLPLGMNIQGLNTNILRKSLEKIPQKSVLETGWGRIFKEEKCANILFPKEDYYGEIRLTVDYFEDFKLYENLIQGIGKSFITYSDKEILDYIYFEKLHLINSHLNAMYWENFNKESSNEMRY